MSASLTCSGCKNPNLTRDDFYWSKKEPNIKTQKQCKACVYKKRHPEEGEEMFSIDNFKKYYTPLKRSNHAPEYTGSTTGNKSQCWQYIQVAVANYTP